MPATPDRRPGESDEEGIILENRPSGETPTQLGGVRFVDGSFSFRDLLGLFNPRGGLPAPSLHGQILASADGSTYSSYRPVASEAGVLIDDDGVIVLVG